MQKRESGRPQSANAYMLRWREMRMRKTCRHVVPLTAEQMSIKYLRARSGVVNGIGIRPSLSLRTTTTLLHANDEAVHLFVGRAEQELRQKIEEQVHDEIEERLQLEQKFDALLEYMKLGHRGPPPDDGSVGSGLGVI